MVRIASVYNVYIAKKADGCIRVDVVQYFCNINCLKCLLTSIV